MIRKPIIVLIAMCLLPFVLVAGACLLAFGAFIVTLDALEDPGWDNRVAGQSTGAEEEV